MPKPIRMLLVAFTVAAISSVAVAAKAPIDLPGSAWATAGTAKFHAQKVGKIAGLLFVDLTFGPTIVPSLSTSEVEMLLDDGMFVIPVSGNAPPYTPERACGPDEDPWVCLGCIEDIPDSRYALVGKVGPDVGDEFIVVSSFRGIANDSGSSSSDSTTTSSVITPVSSR